MNLRDRLELGGCGHLRSFSDGAASGKFARPGSKLSYAPDQDFDSEHIFLDLVLDVPGKTVQGKCAVTLRAIHDGAREIRFDAARMKILSVRGDAGQNLRFTYKDELLNLKLPKALKEGEKTAVTVEYRLVRPIAGVYFIGPDRHYPKKPVQVWTHGEAQESRYWFPCFDAPHDKAVTEMMATVPKDFFALSNGALIAVRENKAAKTKTYHWRQALPHSPYLVTLVAGKFSEIRDDWDGVPVLYYCEPGREDDTRRAFGKTPKMLQFFSDAIGVPYPYEKYAQIAVADFVMGGMEHTTATTQTDRVLMDAKAYPEFTADWLVSHELAHQWFGDLLTCKEWGHAWLNESFATYFEALFAEHDLGKDEFEYEMWDKAKIYFEEDGKNYRRAIVTHVYKKPDDLFDRHLYEKGAVVLHMLRRLLGDALFWKAIRLYVETHQGQAVETNDLINAIQTATGKNLRQFFDQWVFGAGHPEYDVRYWWDESKKTARVRVAQKGNGSSLFTVPVDLEFITPAGKKTFRETLKDKKHDFSYRFAKEPLDFRFDPGHDILKRAEIHKPRRMWERQLESDPHAVGRAQAAKEIAKTADDASLRILFKAFNKEKFWGTASEIAQAMASTRLESARQFLVRALRAKHPKVRRGVAEALGQFQDDDTVSHLGKLFAKDPSYFVAAECVRSLILSRNDRAAATIQKAFSRDSWNEVVRAAAVGSLTRNPGPASFRELKKYAAYGQPLSLRAGALQAMAKTAAFFPEMFAEVLALSADAQTRIQHAAVHALGGLKDPRAVPALEKLSKDKNLPYRTRAAAEDALLKIEPAKDAS